MQTVKPQQAESRADLSSVCAKLLLSLESRQSEGPAHSLTHTLPLLNNVITYSPDCLTEGNVKIPAKCVQR